MNTKQFIKRVVKMVDEMATSKYDCSNYCPGAVKHTARWLKEVEREDFDGSERPFCKRCRELFCNHGYPDWSNNCPCYTWDDWDDLYRHVKKVAEDHDCNAAKATA